MACKDMLTAGLNCIEYKNGARHTLEDYADMALKTANKRAYLYGEGEKRQEFGISTVVVNSRQGGCPLCAEYIGRVFIDDVYSGGKASDGDYPLLSEAIQGGLFHPRCKDSTSTYYEGITTLKKVTQDELDQMAEQEQLENKLNYAKRQEKRFTRLEKYSLDRDNKRMYREEKIEACYDRIDLMSSSFKPKYTVTKSVEFKTYSGIKSIKVKKVANSNFNIVSDSTENKNAVKMIERQLTDIQSMLPESFEIPKIAIVDFEKQGIASVEAIAGYDYSTGTLFFNSRYNTPYKVKQYVNKTNGLFANNTEYGPLLHELGHKHYYDSIKALAKAENWEYNKAKAILDKKIYKFISEKELDNKLDTIVSIHAKKHYGHNKFTEVVAESFSASNENDFANSIIKLLNGD